MPAVKKTELYSKLWSGCDDLRGGIDTSEYKNYILTLLFMKYVSDKYSSGGAYSQVVIPEGGSFQDMLAARNQPDIGERFNKIIDKLANANPSLKGVIDLVDFNDSNKFGTGKTAVDKLTDIISKFETLNLKKNRADDDDLLGDAYEYLMRNFAVESGKSKGQFYTPAEVSRVLAKVIGIGNSTAKNITLYDPACGSGSLLIKAANEANVKVYIYGQEIDQKTASLAKMNMFLHNYSTAEITDDNTLSKPKWTSGQGILKQFDYVVVNPPFSLKAWTQGVSIDNDPFNRWSSTLAPPKKNGDYAWLLHVLRSMKETGRAAIILPYGVLFRGNAEETIRKYFIDNGFIEGIISLPPNLFYGTGIPACILILDKANATQRNGVFMIDASKGFVKDGNKNRLREEDIKRIVDTYGRKLETQNYSRFVHFEEICKKNEYNLNVPRYIYSSDTEILQDIGAHLNGGIPIYDVQLFEKYWTTFPSLLQQLFKPHQRKGYYELAVPYEAIAETIFANKDFIAIRNNFANQIEQFLKSLDSILIALKPGFLPDVVINEISSIIFEKFATAPLLDVYDIYQVFMDTVTAYMRDELYIVSDVGYFEACRSVGREEKVGKNKTGAIVGSVIPPEIISVSYFPKEVEQINEIKLKQDLLSVEMENMCEDDGEDGILSDVKNEHKKKEITKKGIESKLNSDVIDDEDKAILRQYLNLFSEYGSLNTKRSKLKKELANKTFEKYGHLSETDGLTLLFQKHWFEPLSEGIMALFDTLVQELEGEIIELAKRYERKLDTLICAAKENEVIVLDYLKKMGYN